MQTLFKRTPDLSVIIPVYNLEKYITPMLDSLKKQDTGEYEVEYLFVNNNCTDRTEDVILRSGLDCRIIPCSIQGCGSARNAALEVANGDYIWFMDGDDWLLSDMAIKTALDRAKGAELNILRVPFKSHTYLYAYFSMVWQYVLKHDFVKEFRFPDYQPSEDDAYMRNVLNKAGYNPQTYMSLPHVVRPLYFYNFNREGSNMFRFNRGERI